MENQTTEQPAQSEQPTVVQNNTEATAEVNTVLTNQEPVTETKETNFYKNQSHVKAVDNLRRTTGATKEQMQRMFHQINNY